MKPEHYVVSYHIVRYPGSRYAQRITYVCSCGKSGTVHDGRFGVNKHRARMAHSRHAAYYEGKGAS